MSSPAIPSSATVQRCLHQQRYHYIASDNMNSNKAYPGTALACFIPNGASPVPTNLKPSTSSTMKKPRTFTPFSIVDIMKPDKYSPDESVGSSDSDSDALHIDLDRSSDEEQCLVQNDKMRSGAVQSPRSPADDNTNKSRGDDNVLSPADDRVSPVQDMPPAITGNETLSNFTTIYQGQVNHMNTSHRGIPLPQSVSNVYPVSGVIPHAYPMFIPPATPQISEGHPNSCNDSENVAPRASPNCTGRVSPTDSSSSGELCSPSPDTSPVTQSSPTTKKTRRPAGGRTCYTQKQVRAMEQVFSENKYPDYDIIEQLSTDTGIPVKRIKVWFQNKRARRKCRAPETQHLNSPHLAAAMMATSPGFNYLSPMMPQFHYPVSTPAMMSPFPGFPPVYPSTVC